MISTAIRPQIRCDKPRLRLAHPEGWRIDRWHAEARCGPGILIGRGVTARGAWDEVLVIARERGYMVGAWATHG